MTFAKQENQITIALGRCAPSVKRAGNGQWEFTLTNGRPLGVSARLSECWLMLTAPVGERIARGAWWGLLRLNAGIPGSSRFSLRRQVHLCSDIPMADDEVDSSNVLATRLLETCAAFKTAFRSFRGEKAPKSSTTLDVVAEQVEQRGDELRRLCSDTGWPFIERSAGKLMIDLDVRSGFYQAAVEQQAAGISVSSEILHTNALSDASRQALALLLLTTSGQVKLARPSVEEKEDLIEVRFEVMFATPPTANELAHAFSALSVACTTSGREAQSLLDEGIARDYLALRESTESELASVGFTNRSD